MLWINPPGTPTRTTPAAAALLATLLAASPWAAPALEAAEPKEAEPKETESRTASEPEPQAAPAVWQQWRGPQRTGELAAGQAPWPSSLAGLEKVWSAEKLGPSYSGPIVGEKRIFTTETRDESREVVTAYDRHTGEKLWQKQWKGSMKVPFFADANGSWIRSTPAYDGQTLFVGGIQEVLVALDGATGEERWRFNFPARLGTEQPAFGYVCSPLLEDGFLYLEASTSLFKLVAETGEVVWRAEGFSGGDMAGGSFSSPVFAEIGGQRQLVVQSRQELRGVDPESGAVLWSQPVPSFRGMNILTPTVWNDSVLTSTYRNSSFLYRIGEGEAGGFEVEQGWTNEAQAYMSSPVVVADTAYMHLGNGRLTAMSLATGERHWTSKPFGKYWSMVRQGERILALDSGGELILIEASPDELKVLDQREISSSETWAYLAVAGDQVVIRELNGLTVWRFGDSSAGRSDSPSAVSAASFGSWP